MTLTNPRLFGLNINSLLTDVEKKNTAIQNLGINPLDLDIIRGSSNAAMDRFDWISTICAIINTGVHILIPIFGL